MAADREECSDLTEGLLSRCGQTSLVGLPKNSGMKMDPRILRLMLVMISRPTEPVCARLRIAKPDNGK
jgi:hypothetical protein